MDKPNRSTDCARPSPWFDELLVQTSTIALAAARKKCRSDVAQDIAQDIVLGFVEKFAAGRFSAPPTYLDALVKRMVRQRLIDRDRSSVNRGQYEGDYVAAMADNRPVWMHPDDAMEQAELDALHTDILDALPERQRRAFVLVRQDETTYKLAGDALGLTPLAICKHVVRAQQTFRKRLSSAGIGVNRYQPDTDRAPMRADRHVP